MAFIPRKWEVIYNQILATKATKTELDGLTTTSKAGYWLAWAFITAVAVMLLEQIMSIFIDEIETIVASGVPGTAPWLQAKTLKFQSGDAVVINSDFTVGYLVIDTTKQIVTSAAVVASGNGVVNVKAAKGGSTPVPLSAAEQAALSTYLNIIAPAGSNLFIISVNADVLFLNAEIFFNGQYNATISTDVTAAINNYLKTIPFNGTVNILQLAEAIKAVTGVYDVVFTDVIATPDGGTAVQLVTSKTEISRNYQTYAGYITLDGASTLTFTVSQQ